MLDFRRRLTLGENKPPQDVQSHPKKKNRAIAAFALFAGQMFVPQVAAAKGAV